MVFKTTIKEFMSNFSLLYLNQGIRIVSLENVALNKLSMQSHIGP